MGVLKIIGSFKVHLLFYDLHLVGPLNVIVGKTFAVNVTESNDKP